MRNELNPTEHMYKKVQAEEIYIVGGLFVVPTRFDIQVLSE